MNTLQGFLRQLFTEEISLRFFPDDKKLISLSLKQCSEYVLYSSDIAVVIINLVKLIPYRSYACISLENIIFIPDSLNLFDLDVGPDDNYYSLISQESCQYFTLDEFLVIHNTIDNFSILKYNIRSFKANDATFEAILDSIETDYDNIRITETWNTTENLESCRLDGFSSSHMYIHIETI